MGEKKDRTATVDDDDNDNDDSDDDDGDLIPSKMQSDSIQGGNLEVSARHVMRVFLTTRMTKRNETKRTAKTNQNHLVDAIINGKRRRRRTTNY